MTTHRVPDFYPTRVNMRVANLAFAADVAINNGFHSHRFDLNAPAASSVNGLGTFAATTAAVTFAATGQLPYTMAEKYGRHVIVAGTTSSNTGVSTLIGRDYLGGKVITVATNAGSGGVIFPVALKYVDTFIHGGHAGGPVSLGLADRYGLPYKSMALLHSFLNGLSTAAHSLVTPQTAAASAAGSDPRGSVTLNVAADGTKNFSVLLVVDGTNLHGNAQYSG